MRGSHQKERDFEVAIAPEGTGHLGDEGLLGRTNYLDTARAVTDVKLVFVPADIVHVRFSIIEEKLRDELELLLKAKELRHAKHQQLFAEPVGPSTHANARTPGPGVMPVWVDAAGGGGCRGAGQGSAQQVDCEDDQDGH